MNDKRCSLCCEVKTLRHFYRHPQGRYGRHSRCVDCMTGRTMYASHKTQYHTRIAAIVANREAVRSSMLRDWGARGRCQELSPDSVACRITAHTGEFEGYTHHGEGFGIRLRRD